MIVPNAFKPFWKTIVPEILTAYGVFGLFRELLPLSLQKYLVIGVIFTMIPWYAIVITGLVLWLIVLSCRLDKQEIAEKKLKAEAEENEAFLRNLQRREKTYGEILDSQKIKRE